MSQNEEFGLPDEENPDLADGKPLKEYVPPEMPPIIDPKVREGKAFLKVSKAGRPSKFSKAIADEIITYIMAGNYVETACAIAGVDKKTFYTWLKLGHEQKTGAYVQFLHAVEKAAAWSEARDLQAISDAGKTNWTAKAWRMERRFPERWGRRIKLEGGIGLADVTGQLSPEERDRIGKELAAVYKVTDGQVREPS
jgi:transposase